MTKVNKFSIFFRVYLEYFGKFYERLHHYKKYLKETQTRPEKMRAIGRIQEMNKIVRLSDIYIILLETQRDTKSNHKLMDRN